MWCTSHLKWTDHLLAQTPPDALLRYITRLFDWLSPFYELHWMYFSGIILNYLTYLPAVTNYTQRTSPVNYHCYHSHLLSCSLSRTAQVSPPRSTSDVNEHRNQISNSLKNANRWGVGSTAGKYNRSGQWDTWWWLRWWLIHWEQYQTPESNHIECK